MVGEDERYDLNKNLEVQDGGHMIEAWAYLVVGIEVLMVEEAYFVGKVKRMRKTCSILE